MTGLVWPGATRGVALSRADIESWGGRKREVVNAMRRALSALA